VFFSRAISFSTSSVVQNRFWPTPRYAPLLPTAAVVGISKKKKKILHWFNLRFIHRQHHSCHNGVVRDVCLLGGDKFTYQFL
jgi:hypothetical protein